MFCLIPFLLLSVNSPVPAQEKADFLLLARPAALSILNQYELKLPAAEKAGLPAGAPFRVIREQGTLGDQATPAREVRWQNRVYFLELDEAGKLKGEAAAGMQVYKGCPVAGDTIRVEKNGILRLADPAAGGSRPGRGAPLAKGEILIRQFKHRDQYYVLKPGPRPQYGWVNLAKTAAWTAVKKAAPVAVAASIPAAVQNQIIQRLQAANQAYRKFFAYFDQLNQEQKSPPRWTWQAGKDRITCRLNGPSGPQLAASTPVLARNLENLLIGRPFRVTSAAGEITIEPK